MDLNKILNAIYCILDDYDAKKDYFSMLSEQRKELEGWYESNTLNELSYLILKYDEIKRNYIDGGMEALFHICLSNVLTTVCSQNGGWAYIADNVKPKKECLKNKHTIEKYRLSLEMCVKGINEHKRVMGDYITNIYQNKMITNVVNADILQVDLSDLKGKVNLVVTSPPYPRMIDYVKSQRLSFYVENGDFSEGLQREIGARYRRNNKGTIEKYINDMQCCNRKIYECLVRGGYLCYILPQYPKETDRKEAIDAVINHCYQLGFKEKYRTERCIPGTQRSNNIKWASLKKEQIVVMEKI